MLSLIKHWEKIPEFKSIIDYLQGGGQSVLLTGADRIHKIHLSACIRYATERPVVVICSDEMDGGRFKRDLDAFFGNTPILCQRDFTFYNAEGVSRQIEQDRLRILHGMYTGEMEFVISTVPALMQRCITKDIFKNLVFSLKSSQQISIENIVDRLLKAGFSRTDQVEGRGQFSTRGGILDFFSTAYDFPVRCEFWGDEIDTLTFFDPATQRRTEKVDDAVILPVGEAAACFNDISASINKIRDFYKKLERRKNKSQKFMDNMLIDIDKLENNLMVPGLDKYMDIIYDSFETAVDYIPQNAVILIDEPAATLKKGESFIWQISEDIKSLLENEIIEGTSAKFVMEWPDICQKLRNRNQVLMQNFSGSTGLDGRHYKSPDTIIQLKAKQLSAFGISMETAMEDIKHYTSLKSEMRLIALSSDERRAKIICDGLMKEGVKAAFEHDLAEIPEKGKCTVTLGSLSAGIEYISAGIVILTEGFHAKAAQKKRRRSDKTRQALTSYADLSHGDLVVHEQHGIGRFVGIFPMSVDGGKKDFIKILYQGGDSLYVPATNLDVVSKYIGNAGGKTKKLSKMGGTDWSKVKNRAKGAAKDLAKGLIELYSQRQNAQGHAFSPDSVWQTEFEDEFEYELTEDQAQCVREIKGDMEKSSPMDRLLCGDVGYGKTEVAMRAVMKCILDGKQAAILVPTTVLAQQHYQTCIDRFSSYPVKVEVLSRYKTPAKVKKAVKEITDGNIDIIIGTHRLLQKDVKFKDLGMLVVDEEQRFGVSHKERLKEMSKNVDVLTLSATPIPRTLNMAMSGIRDMSTIQEPPQDRHPVQTYVMEHDWSVIADAIRKEISRGGQVYFLHNRVENIDNTAAKLLEMMPGINVMTAHGKMDENRISKVMEAMTAGEIDVLVCTTIIETGIDIPNVNTLIIEDADRFGLSQLHQIRGRVGRSNRHAFAYLTYRQGKILTEVASKRLAAIREFAEFNSGFKIAMRDLEIRGAGNLLGSEQSGHMVSVGYDMYLKLLEEAVSEAKGEASKKVKECSIDILVSANIPEKYVPSPEQRMDLYRSIARIRSEEDAEDMFDELIDRYGDPPKSVISLVNVSLMRGMAAKFDIVEISQKDRYLTFKFSDFDMERISEVYPKFKNRIKVLAGNVPGIELKIANGQSPIDAVTEFIHEYGDNGGGGEIKKGKKKRA